LELYLPPNFGTANFTYRNFLTVVPVYFTCTVQSRVFSWLFGRIPSEDMRPFSTLDVAQTCVPRSFTWCARLQLLPKSYNHVFFSLTTNFDRMLRITWLGIPTGCQEQKIMGRRCNPCSEQIAVPLPSSTPRNRNGEIRWIVSQGCWSMCTWMAPAWSRLISQTSPTT
jgi:hypothetical protein